MCMNYNQFSSTGEFPQERFWSVDSNLVFNRIEMPITRYNCMATSQGGCDSMRLV
jgi:hypothetical protein